MSSQKTVDEPTVERPLLPKQPEVNIGSAGHVDHGKCLRMNQYAFLNGMPLTGGEIEAIALNRGRLLSRLDGGELYEFEAGEVVSVDGGLAPRRSKALFYVQDFKGPVYEVSTRTGRTIAVTPEHPLLVNRQGKLEWVKSKDLSVGEHVAFLSMIPETEGTAFGEPIAKMRERYVIVTWQDRGRLERLTDGFRDLTSLGPRDLDSVRILAGIPGTTLARRARFDYHSWLPALSGDRPLAGQVRSRIGRVLASADIAPLRPGEFLAVRRQGNHREVARFKGFDMDEDTVKWFAFVWSEGTSDGHKVVVTQTLERKMLAEYVRITTEKMGVRIRSYRGGEYAIHNTAFVDYLRLKFGFAVGNKFASPILPWVCLLPGRQKAVFLRWFLSLDGEFNRRAGQISISQANPRNIVILSYLLSMFGIVPRFSSKKVTLKRGPMTYSRLSISGRRNLELFAKNIGFESERKQKALDDYLRRIHPESKESDLSVPLDPDSLRRLMKSTGLMREGFRPEPDLPTMKGSAWYKAFESLRRTGRISRPKLLQILGALQDQLGRLDASLTSLPKDRSRAKRHLSMMGVSIREAAQELGMGWKKLNRILTGGAGEEMVIVADALCKWTSRILQEAEPAMAQLRALASTPLEFDRVASIKKVPYEGKVFDLSVPDHANFVAGMGALVAHNTTTIQGITGVWASAHSEELKRGITIKVGYADAAFYKCPSTPAPAAYCTSPKCPVCGKDTKLLRAVSFVDCPGHESLMTNMLAGAFLMDGALLVIAANEPVPKPQTREHLQALQMLGMKKIVIAQNKVDLVTDQEAKKNEEAIKEFVANTVAADAPIVPVSAQQRLNVDALIEALEEVIPTPARDPKADPLMYVVRSFDVNRPGMEVKSLAGGVLGGSLVKGEFHIGDEVEVRPGMPDERTGKYVPILTKVSTLQTGAGPTEKVGPGGLVAVGTHLDPTYIKSDQMVGSVLGKPGTLPETLDHITLNLELFEVAVGSAQLVKVDKVRPGENLRLNLGTASSPAVVTSARGDVIEVDLKKPVALESGMRVAVNRRIAERWRLIGSGQLK